MKNSPKLVPKPILTWKFHFLSIEPIKRCRNANEPIKLHNKWNEPIKMLQNWNAQNKSKEKEDEPIETWK